MTFWAAGIPRIPLLAAVIASLAYTALAEQPNSVLRTLPLTDTDGAVIRWWAAFGLPIVAMGDGVALAAWLSAHKGWIFPSALWLATCMASSVAAAAGLSAIGRAFSHWSKTSASGYVAIVWVALTIVAIIGLPMTVLSAPILCLIFIGSLCLSAGACLPVSRSVRISQSSEPRDRVLTPSWLRSRFSLRATGWTVMVFEVGRTTAIICVAAFITATIIHRGIAPWARAGLNGLVIWGLGIPGYMLVVFLPAPVTLIRWQRPAQSRPHYLPLLWGPTIQQAVWPAWAGVFCSMLGLPFMPSWFFVYLAALAALFSIAAYRAPRAGIRSPTMLESHDCATLESV